MKIRSLVLPVAAAWLALSSAAHAAPPYPGLLPPEPAVRSMLEGLPEIRAARARAGLESVEAQRLQAGPYEWTATATAQRRTDRTTGTDYRESGLALERPVRWFGKAGKDEALGAQRVRIGTYALADAWHEAARLFLKDWFAAVREARAAALLQQQVAVQEQQLDSVRKRVKAGDAPRMDLRLAEAERDRAMAAQRQAEQRSARAAAELERHYPGVRLALPAQLPAPEAAGHDIDSWTRQIVDENHEIELARAEAEAAKLNAERKSLDRMPDPTVGVHMMQERDRQERIVGVTISIPIPGSARRLQSDAGAAEALIAREKAEQVRNRVQRDAAAVAMAAAAANENWERLQQLAQQSGENAELVAKAYALGEVTIGETLLARRQSLEALAAAEAAQIDALEAQARLQLDAHAFWEAPGHDTP